MIFGYLLFAFIGLSAPYYIYYGIIAPTRRLNLKFDLFQLRDRLYELKRDHPDELSDEVFEEARAAINGTMLMVDDITVLGVRRAVRAASQDREFMRETKRRHEAIKECPVGEVQELMLENFLYLYRAVWINSLGGVWYWWPYLHATRAGRKIKDHFKEVSLMGNRSKPSLPKSIRPVV